MMKTAERIILAVYLTLTFAILYTQIRYLNSVPTWQLMYAVRVSMLVATLVVKKRTWEQKMIALSFVFTVISDFFLVYVKTFDFTLANRQTFGMLGFMGAYICLILGFSRKVRFVKTEAVAALIFAAIFLWVFIIVQPYAQGVMFIAAIVTGLVLCYFGLTTVATLTRGYFSRRTAWKIALAGCMLFLSDMFVAVSIFHPDYQGFILWREMLIWITYVPAWALLLTVVADEAILEADASSTSSS